MSVKEEKRAARQAEDRERLQEAVAELSSEAGFRRWLEVRSAMHDYSFNNLLLIALQRPDATRVAGYGAWQKLGRQVRKGERGIHILAPRVVKVADPEDPEAEKVRRCVGFIGVSVFDVSQTDGEDLGSPPKSAPIEGDSHAALIPELVAAAGEIGYTVKLDEDLPDKLGGYCDSTGKVIAVAAGTAPNATVRVLLHEIAHAHGVGYAEYGRGVAEVIVEAAAAIAAKTVGLEIDLTSVPYIAGWALGEPDKISEQAEAIDSIARKLTDAVIS